MFMISSRRAVSTRTVVSASLAAGLETLFARLLERRPADSAEALLRQRLHHELE
ncbi:hypothetical protein AB3459_33005, partial [Pseudomonas aeruginosa]